MHWNTGQRLKSFYLARNFSENPRLAFWCYLKNMFLLKFAPILLLFLPFFKFLRKNVENAYFNQHLECVAPNHWLKYTTSLAGTKRFSLVVGRVNFFRRLILRSKFRVSFVQFFKGIQK